MSQNSNRYKCCQRWRAVCAVLALSRSFFSSLNVKIASLLGLMLCINFFYTPFTKPLFSYISFPFNFCSLFSINYFFRLMFISSHCCERSQHHYIVCCATDCEQNSITNSTNLCLWSLIYDLVEKLLSNYTQDDNYCSNSVKALQTFD